MKNNHFWADAWFLSRVVVGWLIHALLIACSIFNIEVMYKATYGFHVNHVSQPLIPPALVGMTMSRLRK